MKLHIYLEKNTKPIILTTNDNDINEISNIIEKAMLKNGHLKISNGSEVLILKASKVAAIKVMNEPVKDIPVLSNTEKKEIDIDIPVTQGDNLNENKSSNIYSTLIVI